MDKKIENCSQCDLHTDPNNCKMYNNFIARTIGFVSGTNRSLCIDMIKQKGPDGFASFMVENKFQSIPKKYRFRS